MGQENPKLTEDYLRALTLANDERFFQMARRFSRNFTETRFPESIAEEFFKVDALKNLENKNINPELKNAFTGILTGSVDPDKFQRLAEKLSALDDETFRTILGISKDNGETMNRVKQLIGQLKKAAKSGCKDDECWKIWTQIVNESPSLKGAYAEFEGALRSQLPKLETSFRRQVAELMLCSGVGALAGTGAYLGAFGVQAWANRLETVSVDLPTTDGMLRIFFRRRAEGRRRM